MSAAKWVITRLCVLMCAPAMFAQVITEQGGNVGIATQAPSGRLHIVGSAEEAGTLRLEADPSKGPNQSHVHWGPTGDWYIRSAARRAESFCRIWAARSVLGRVIRSPHWKSIARLGTLLPSRTEQIDLELISQATDSFSALRPTLLSKFMQIMPQTADCFSKIPATSASAQSIPPPSCMYLIFRTASVYLARVARWGANPWHPALLLGVYLDNRVKALLQFSART